MSRNQYLPDLVVTEPGAVWTDVRAYTTIDLAIAAMNAKAGGGTLLITGDYTLSASVTVDEDVTLKFVPGNVITIATGQTLTIKGFIDAGPYHIFSRTGTGKVYSSKSASSSNLNCNQTYPEWFGAAGDCDSTGSGTDDTLAVQGAIDFFTNGTTGIGGTVLLGWDRRYKINSADISLGEGVMLKGHQPAGTGYTGDVRTMGSAIVLNPSYTIQTEEDSGIQNIVIVSSTLEAKGYSYPANTAGCAAWTGAAITFGGGSHSYIRECTIAGFQYGVYKDPTGGGSNGLFLSKLFIDCTNGIYIGSINNFTLIDNIYCWNLATYQSTPTGDGNPNDRAWWRTGAGIYIDDIDWGSITNCFVRGANRGFHINAANGNADYINLTNCAFEGNVSANEETQSNCAGFVVGAANADLSSIPASNPAWVRLVNCTSNSGNSTNNASFYFNTSAAVIAVTCEGFGSATGFYATVNCVEPRYIMCTTGANTTNYVWADATYGYSYVAAIGELTELAGSIRFAGQMIAPMESITATSAGVQASHYIYTTYVATNGDADEDIVTLADGNRGQIKVIACTTYTAGDSWKIVPTNLIGGTKISFSGYGGCTLMMETGGWIMIGTNGGTIS